MHVRAVLITLLPVCLRVGDATSIPHRRLRYVRTEGTTRPCPVLVSACSHDVCVEQSKTNVAARRLRKFVCVPIKFSASTNTSSYRTRRSYHVLFFVRGHCTRGQGGQLRTKVYDKRDDYNLFIVNFNFHLYIWIFLQYLLMEFISLSWYHIQKFVFPIMIFLVGDCLLK